MRLIHIFHCWSGQWRKEIWFRLKLALGSMLPWIWLAKMASKLSFQGMGLMNSGVAILGIRKL